MHDVWEMGVVVDHFKKVFSIYNIKNFMYNIKNKINNIIKITNCTKSHMEPLA